MYDYHPSIGHTVTEEMKTESKYVVSDDGIRSQSEVNIMVGKDIINLKDLSAPQVRYFTKSKPNDLWQ